MTAVKLEKVECIDDGRLIFRGLDLELPAGEKVAVTGDLGSGRTNLIDLITGYSAPESGRVLVFGADINRVTSNELAKIRSRIGVVFQRPALISNLKVMENVMLPLVYHKNVPRQEAMEQGLKLLARVGYNDDPWRLPGNLPLYKGKAVALARALVLGPEIIVYDRFLEGLDSRERSYMVGLIKETHEEVRGRLSIFTANDLDDLRGIGVDMAFRITDKTAAGYDAKGI